MRAPMLASSLVLAAAGALAAAEDGLLLHWSCDEGAGAITRDLSGNGLDGAVRAEWVDSPSGKALRFDGAAEHIVSVQVPEPLRFGRDSWTFMALLNPEQLTIEDSQNQRRLFAFGTYPDAYLVIDLMSTGAVSCYFCYRAEDGRILSTGAGTSLGLKTGEWAHAALVCDRAARQIALYINGLRQGSGAIPAEFDGNFVLGGLLTLGSAWHNYWGLMDEIRVYRRALSRAEVRAEYDRLKGTFGIVESPEAVAAAERTAQAEAAAAALAEADTARAARDFRRAREGYARVAAAAALPAPVRSIAHLRLAQTWSAEGKRDEARAEYARIAAEPGYPAVHRYEAGECLQELDRLARGLPARDPAASRTRVPPVEGFAAEVWVAPDGNDANDGSTARPFATLGRARDAVRALRQQGVAGPIGVRVREGLYRAVETLALTAEDSGAPGAPVVYRAEPMGRAVIYGGARLAGFSPVTDPAVLERLPPEARGHVVQCDLRAQGIEDFGVLRMRGFALPPAPPTVELFVNGTPMTMARWPNEGFVRAGKLLDKGSAAEKRPAVFEYQDDRHARWAAARDVWFFGYFRYLWADAAIPIARIDTAARTVTTAEPYPYGGSMDEGQGIIYYAFNLLEELDQPGEWYLDRTTGILYLYPPCDLADAQVEIGMLPAPMVTLDKVSDVRFEGLVFDLGRAHGIVATDCERCLFAGCTIRRLAGNGITIAGGRQNVLLGCDIHTIGRRASEVIGGDRASLTPGGHVVENCRIYNFGRIDRTYTPAVQLEGVGNRVAHNLMYDCPSSVMRIEGNDHLIEFNEVHSAVRESDDQGAMELFMNPTYRGVIFRYNRYYHVGKTGSEAAVHGQAAIRLDDAISGILIYGNIFYRAANGHFGAVQMNSGRDNVMDNNIFADCRQGISGGWHPGNSVWRMIAENRAPEDFYTSPLYLERYPEIGAMMTPPGINHVWRNVFFRCGRVTTGNPDLLDQAGNGVFEDDPGFVDAAGGDFRLKPDAALFDRVAFRPIPAEEIGLYADAYRASWPVVTTPVPMPDWRRPPAR